MNENGRLTAEDAEDLRGKTEKTKAKRIVFEFNPNLKRLLCYFSFATLCVLCGKCFYQVIMS